MSIPTQFQEYFDHDAKPSIFQCRRCNTSPDHFEVIEIDEQKDFISLSCTSTDCTGIGTWFICRACNQSFTRYSKAEKHAGTSKHKKNVERRSEEAQKNNTCAVQMDVQQHETAFDSSQSNFYPLADSQDTFLSIDIGRESFTLCEDDNGDGHVGFSQMETDLFDDTIDAHSSAKANDVKNSTALDTSGIVGTYEGANGYKALDPRHNWLAEILKDSPKAKEKDILDALSCSPNMQRFWLAENNSPGGGLVFLVTRAFMRTNFLGADQMADLEEAKWQMQNFMLYVNMSERQRSWHAQITMKVTSHGSDLIKKTRIPNPQELKRFYMSDSQYSLYQSLPIPQIRNVKGIAYVNPVDIVRLAFAFGLPIDDICVTRNTPTGNFLGKQCHVADSPKLRNLMRMVQEAQPEENGDYRIVLAWCTEWRDGFGVNRTKNNRKSVVAWTFSVSPSKANVNSVGNTFPMALGQKKNPAWPEVEHEVRKDTSILNDPTKPLWLYHGGVRKMVPVFVSIINSSNDKPERADITGTLGFNGNTHRCFGKLIQIVSPTCNSKKVQEALNAANPCSSNGLSNGLEFGWSDRMIDSRQDSNLVDINGAVLPSCNLCRTKNLHALLGHFPGAARNVSQADINTNYGKCDVCADWTMDSTTASKLPFKAPDDYPTTCAPNCPVEPPPGRCTTIKSLIPSTCPVTGKTTYYLLSQDLEFQNLVKATKFAFFNLVADKAWTASAAKAYLTACGIAPKYAAGICRIAKEAIKAGRAKNVDYTNPECIDEFRFPAAWIDRNLSMKDYIETLMHILCLGLAEGNFELCSMWMKERGRDASFRRSAQELLLDIKSFGLNWLHAYPFSSSEDPKNPGGKHGTGAWQSENWIAWIRISKVVYLNASAPSTAKNPKTTGNWDIFRLVIAFTGLAARAMSHSGVDESDVQEFDRFVKEFFSCVRELDIQTRHNDMQKKKKKTAEGQEPQGTLSVERPMVTGNVAGTEVLGNSGGATGKKGGTQRIKPLVSIANSSTRSAGSKSQKKPAAIASNRKKMGKGDDDSDYEPENNTPAAKTKTTRKSKAKVKKRKHQEIVDDEASEEPIGKIGTKKKRNKSQPKDKKKPETTGGAEAYWTRSNYLSLPNLVAMMQTLGLLINFWDGGGKGEKFVQEVKPLICRGVHDYESFFVVVMEKLYKFRVLDILREMYSLFSPESSNEDENSKPQFWCGIDGEITRNEPDKVTEEIPSETLHSPDGQIYSSLEDQHMFKLKTFYHYRSKANLDKAMAEKKPISGILVHNENDAQQMDFYVLYKEKKAFFAKKIIFDDSTGVMMGGLWYADMECVDATQAIPQEFEGIQDMAKMSTVAIPMSYGIGQDKPHSDKCCVITNWWNERQPDGRYTKPGLDPAYYVREDKYEPALAIFDAVDGNNII